MSDALIASLNQRVNELTTEAANLKAALREARGETKSVKASLAELATARDAVATERDKLKATVEAAPGEKDRQIAELAAQLRTRDHRDAWQSAIGGKLADKVDIADVWAKLQYTPGETTPSAEDIGKAFQSVQDLAPYLIKPEGGGSSAPSPSAARLNGAIGAGRGASDQSSSGRVTYTRDEIAQPGWMAKRPELVAALKDDRAILVD